MPAGWPADLKVLYPTQAGIEWTLKGGLPYHVPDLMARVRRIVAEARARRDKMNHPCYGENKHWMALTFGPHFLIDCLSIIVIDLLLAGDNALVIALAVRSLPMRQRRAAIAAGAALAVVFRIAVTFIAAQILTVEFLKLAGGAFVVWIAVKVLVDSSDEAKAAARPKHLLQAVWFIVLADLTMSTDNILAVAGASRGNAALIVFGLCVSIPFVVFSSNLLSILMDRYPALIYGGAAILGKVGAEMMLSDGFVVHALHPTGAMRYGAEAALALGTVLLGRLLATQRAATPAA